ncbi:hypothetical protein [Saliterribacillus persicus]|uniref:Uncharacterized protein n=1 Tax=Saliterribacillus persicus TaxID=930114 RepID=A0A368Y9E5_9BACI|nr:hypothetical protein [Saliterribacillus persicus]RCW76873.1 hypothetical protein DFR57_102148 [Saliterribacillus persicus]
MRNATTIIFGNLIIATYLGIYGQSVADFLNENFIKISPIFYLTILTFTSVFLYLSSFVYTYLLYKKKRIEKDKIDLYLPVILGIGLLTSCWSLFVLAMWWG